MAETTEYLHAKGWSSNPYLAPYIEIKDLIVKAKAIKPLEENTCKPLCPVQSLEV